MSRWIADRVLGRPWVIVAAGLLLAVAGAVAGLLGVRLDADTDSLIDPDRPFMRDYEAFKARFGDLERIWVVIDAEGDAAKASAVVDWIEPRLSELGLPQVVARIDGDEQARLLSWSAPPARVEAIASSCGLLSTLSHGADAFLSAATSELDGAAALLGLDTAERQKRASSAVTALTIFVDEVGSRPDRLLRSPSGRLHFIGVLPHKDYATLSVIESPLKRIRAVLDDARAVWPGVEIGLTGKPVIQADEMRTTQADMRLAAIVALILVSALVIGILREVKRPLLVLIAFALAVGWTWGFVALALGRLTLLSIVFLLVMIGVGLDFGVHVISRHAVLREKVSLEETIRTILATTGRSNAVAAATSVAVFLTSLATDFRGLQELGIIAAAGILLSVVSMSTVLPALLVVFDRQVRGGGAPSVGVRPARARLLVLCIALAGGVYGWLEARHLRFETNLLALQASDLSAATWERRIAADAGAPTWFAAMQARDRHHAANLVHRAGLEPAIGRVEGILDIVGAPDPAREAAREAIVHCKARDAPASDQDARDRAVAALGHLASLAAGRSKEDAVTLRALAHRLAVMDPEQLEAAGRATLHFIDEVKVGARGPLRDILPEARRRESMAPDGTMLVTVHPRDDVWDEGAMSTFVDAIRRVDPEVTGVPITHLESLRDMKRGFITMTAWAAIVVAAIMVLESRRLREPLVCMGALAIAGGWTLGGAALLGLHLNLANFFAVPVLLGLGVDGAIHVAHRLRAGETDGATRRAVLLTSLTTMAGFGSLLLASHRGLASLGGLMAIGCVACLIASLVVVPAAMRTRS